MTVDRFCPGVTRLVGAIAIAAAAFAVAGVPAYAASSALPNPCTVLASAHAEDSVGSPAAAVTAGKLKTYGTGRYLELYCSENVGTLSVSLSLVGEDENGFGGVKVTSTTHPGGLGSDDTLIVGTDISGGPVDFINFHRGSVYADLGANGASPSGLTALAQKIYKLIP
jgi:hypothetical protein